MAILRALRIGLWLSRRFPYTLLRLLHHPLGLLFWVCYPEARHAAIANQRRVLEHLHGRPSRLWLQWQAYRVLVNVARNYHALIRLRTLPPEKIRDLVELRGDEHLAAALAEGRGVIILGAHIAPYNVLAPFTALYRRPAGVFVEPLRPRELFEFVSAIRARTGLRLLPPDRQGVAAARQLLREGGILLVTGDRYLGANGAPVEFFGRQTLLPQGPVVLALRNRVPLLPARLRGRPRGRLLVKLGPPLPLVDSGRMREDLATNMRLVAQALEQSIGEVPEQWIVLSPVWPNGSTAAPVSSSNDLAGLPPVPLAADARAAPLADPSSRTGSSRS